MPMSRLQNLTLTNEFFQVLTVQKVQIFNLLLLAFKVPNLLEYLLRSSQYLSLLTVHAV